MTFEFNGFSGNTRGQPARVSSPTSQRCALIPSCPAPRPSCPLEILDPGAPPPQNRAVNPLSPKEAPTPNVGRKPSRLAAWHHSFNVARLGEGKLRNLGSPAKFFQELLSARCVVKNYDLWRKKGLSVSVLQQRVVRERNPGPSCPETPAGGLSTWSCWSCNQ